MFLHFIFEALTNFEALIKILNKLGKNYHLTLKALSI